MIDGATDLGAPGLVGTRGGAAWIAMEADAAFAAVDDGDVRSICDAVFGRLARRFDARRARDPVSGWEIPSAAFLVARATADTIEIGWLGDCSAILKRGDRTEPLGPLAEARQGERDHASRLAEHGLGLDTRPAPIVDSLRQQRERPGRHVLSPQPTMADKVNVAAVPARHGDELLLMSDGFSALIDSYGAVTPADMMAALPMAGLAALVGQLRDIERDDAGCARFPRFKRSDDATALWLRIVD